MTPGDILLTVFSPLLRAPCHRFPLLLPPSRGPVAWRAVVRAAAAPRQGGRRGRPRRRLPPRADAVAGACAEPSSTSLPPRSLTPSPVPTKRSPTQQVCAEPSSTFPLQKSLPPRSHRPAPYSFAPSRPAPCVHSPCPTLPYPVFFRTPWQPPSSPPTTVASGRDVTRRDVHCTAHQTRHTHSHTSPHHENNSSQDRPQSLL